MRNINYFSRYVDFSAERSFSPPGRALKQLCNALTRRTENGLKNNQIFPGHDVFAVILPEPCSFMQKFFQKIPYPGFPAKSDQSQKRAIFGTFS